MTKLPEKPSSNITYRKEKGTECHCDYEGILSDFQNKMTSSLKTTIEVQNEKLNSTLDTLRQNYTDFRQQFVNINIAIKNISEEQVVFKKDMCLMKYSNKRYVSKLD